MEVRMPGPFFLFATIVGLATLAAAIYFAFRPAERTLATLRPLCAATIFSSLAAFFLGIANGLVALNRALERATDPAASATVWRMFLGGLAEAPAALILGFAIVAVSWLLVAVGLRRQA
jgi:magnesium-transporting ATPase (P-type)